MNVARLRFRSCLALSLAAVLFPTAALAQPFEGFGAATTGAGSSGYTSLVVNRTDDPDPTVSGTLRHALTQTGARYVTFANSLAGKTITLNRRLIIDGSSRGQLTVDGSNVIDSTDSNIRGVAISGYEISIKNTSQVIFKELRIRRGRDLMDRSQFRYGNGSSQLDCISLEDVSDVVLHRISFAWSADEIVGVIRAQNVTISECIFAEPLGDVAVSPRGTSSSPKDPLPDQIHPYGANHNYCINASAATLSLIRNLFYNYRTRGPQFEANDVRSGYPEIGGQRFVKMEAVNNVMFNYTESGSRYGADIENDTPSNALFDFQFIGNLYYSHGPNHGTDTGPKEIVAASTDSPTDPALLKIHVSGNFGPNRLSANASDPNDERRVVFAKNPSSGNTVQVNNASTAYNDQVITTGTTSLSGAPVITISNKTTFLATILASVGSHAGYRDDTDARIIDTVMDEDTSEERKTHPPTTRPGRKATLTATAIGTIQWQHNGTNITGATAATLDFDDLQPANAGIYTANITNGSTVTQEFKILGFTTSRKVIGHGEQIDADVAHPNGNVFDQVLLTGPAEAITADHTQGQITRTSYIDLDGDIVQVEFSGPGTLSLVLESSNDPPAPPTNYNQNVNYMKGHAGIVITGANEQTNVSVFTVGRATANDNSGNYNILLAPSDTNNPATNGSPLFVGHEATDYDGIADIAFIAISTTNGKFGGVRTANANYFAAQGLTGLYAPGVDFQGPVFIGDINAYADATPVLIVGSAADTRITGGSLSQDNDKAVQVSGLTALAFTPGSDSHGTPFDAQPNAAVLEDNGVDVTATIVVNPTQ